MNELLLHQPGMLTTVQDLGRPFFRRSGVPVGGAVDRFALRVANLLVGNPENAPALECTLVGPDVSFAESTWVAVCGASVAGVPMAKPVQLFADDVLSLQQFQAGARAYLAVAGGLVVPPVLESAATYSRGGFGGHFGRALRKEDRLQVGPSETDYEDVDHWSLASDLLPNHRASVEVRFVRGLQADWFAAGTYEQFQSRPYRVMPQSDRMGVRFNGAKVEQSDAREMMSEPVAEGAIQVPPDGQPIVLLADCQTIGGYPKIGHVISVDLPIIAQLRADDSVRFRECSLAEAQKELLARETALAILKEGLAQKRL